MSLDRKYLIGLTAEGATSTREGSGMYYSDALAEAKRRAEKSPGHRWFVYEIVAKDSYLATLTVDHKAIDVPERTSVIAGDDREDHNSPNDTEGGGGLLETQSPSVDDEGRNQAEGEAAVIAAALTPSEQAFMRFWGPQNDDDDTDAYPDKVSLEKAMMEDFERRGLWKTVQEECSVDGETDIYTTHGLTPLGLAVAALVPPVEAPPSPEVASEGEAGSNIQKVNITQPAVPEGWTPAAEFQFDGLVKAGERVPVVMALYEDGAECAGDNGIIGAWVFPTRDCRVIAYRILATPPGIIETPAEAERTEAQSQAEPVIEQEPENESTPVLDALPPSIPRSEIPEGAAVETFVDTGVETVKIGGITHIVEQAPEPLQNGDASVFADRILGRAVPA